MLDFTHGNTNNLFEITIFKSNTDNKLKFVKILKDHLGIGLKEGKLLADDAFSGIPNTFKCNISDIKEFEADLLSFDVMFTTSNKQLNRNLSILKLGFGTIDEMIDEIVDFDLTEYFVKKSELKQILIDRYKLIPEDELKKIINLM